jgi:hypothetical protein
MTKFWAPNDSGTEYVGVAQVDEFIPNLTKGTSVHINNKGLYWVSWIEHTTLRHGKNDIWCQFVFLTPNPPKKKKRWIFG